MAMAKVDAKRVERQGPGIWRYDYFLVLYINGVRTRVLVPIRDDEGLTNKAVILNNARYFYKKDTEREGR